MRYVWRQNPARFVRFAKEVFGVQEQDEAAAVEQMIARLIAFLRQIGLPTTLGELTAETVPLDEIARLATRAPLGNFKRLDAGDVKAILALARGD
jgi:alcohol dehydrogenase YqhD (iron-dependent ADH family)